MRERFFVGYSKNHSFWDLNKVIRSRRWYSRISVLDEYSFEATKRKGQENNAFHCHGRNNYLTPSTENVSKFDSIFSTKSEVASTKTLFVRGSIVLKNANYSANLQQQYNVPTFFSWLLVTCRIKLFFQAFDQGKFFDTTQCHQRSSTKSDVMLDNFQNDSDPVLGCPTLCQWQYLL